MQTVVRGLSFYKNCRERRIIPPYHKYNNEVIITMQRIMNSTLKIRIEN